MIWNYITNNPKISLFGLLLLLALFKLPAIFFSNIQPWDEGMYAARVNSIYINGDFWEQAGHSVAGMDSGSQPPLLIWIGYFTTQVFGFHDWVLKLIPFIFGLFTVIVLVKIGEELFYFKTGFLSAIIFSSCVLFSIYIKRFQFDIPVLFFILLSFYFIIKFLKNPDYKYCLFTGIFFGLSLMTKLFVGFVAPLIFLLFFIALFFHKNTFNRQKIFTGLVIISVTGLFIALPWYVYMFSKYGELFTNYLFGFHLYQRVLEGVDDNTKPSGIFFYINYLLTLFPFALIVFYGIYAGYKNKNYNKWQRLLLLLWFLVPFVLVSLFKTKLEAYAFLFLPAFSIILANYVLNNNWSEKDKKNIFVLLIINAVWFFLGDSKRAFLSFVSNNLLIALPVLLALIIFLLTKKESLNFNKFFSANVVTAFILLFFVFNNVYLFFNPPIFENSFKLSNIKNYFNNNNVSEFIYVAPQYKYNPQLSYYFNGVDLGWQKTSNKGYKWNLVEMKEDTVRTKSKLDSLKNNFNYIIVEKDNMNRGTYFETSSFIPNDYKMTIKNHGYELWERK